MAREKERDIKDVGTLVIDVHTHLPPDVSLEKIIENVDKAVIMARQGMTARETLDFHAKYPDRVIPFVPFQVRGWILDEPNFLWEVERYLKTGKFKGMGEVVLWHYGVPEIGAREFDIPADSDRMKHVVKLAAKYKVPVLIHLEAEPETGTGSTQ